jgi:hypothetical protein
MRIETKGAKRDIVLRGAKLEVEYDFYFQSSTFDQPSESELVLKEVKGDVLSLIHSFYTTDDIECEINEVLTKLIYDEHGF